MLLFSNWYFRWNIRIASETTQILLITRRVTYRDRTSISLFLRLIVRQSNVFYEQCHQETYSSQRNKHDEYPTYSISLKSVVLGFGFLHMRSSQLPVAPGSTEVDRTRTL